MLDDVGDLLGAAAVGEADVAPARDADHAGDVHAAVAAELFSAREVRLEVDLLAGVALVPLRPCLVRFVVATREARATGGAEMRAVNLAAELVGGRLDRIVALAGVARSPLALFAPGEHVTVMLGGLVVVRAVFQDAVRSGVGGFAVPCPGGWRETTIGRAVKQTGVFGLGLLRPSFAHLFLLCKRAFVNARGFLANNKIYSIFRVLSIV